jgi:hypothetical protein
MEMIELVLGLAFTLGGGDATWYGEDGRCYDGHWKTCTPYLSGEQVFYAAVGSWRWGDKPYRVNVCRPANGRCVTVWVRDFCRACKNKFGVIDLSPAAFRKLAPLGRGRIKVVVSEYREEYVRGR